MYTQEKTVIKQMIKAKGEFSDTLELPGGQLIEWPNQNEDGKMYLDNVLLEKAGSWAMKTLQEFLNLKTDYCNPEFNPAIVTDSDLFQPEPDETEKKPDEIDYTDPNQNPAIPIID